MTPVDDFRARLLAAIASEGWRGSRAEVEDRTGIDISKLSNWARDPNHWRQGPTLAYMHQIANALGVSPRWLIMGEGGMER